MQSREPFGPQTKDDIRDLIENFPLAMVTSPCTGDRTLATPLPLIADYDPAGTPARLIGHFARSNPHVRHLRDNAVADLLFQGPQGYVSPSFYSNRRSAPTWIYCVVRIRASLTFDDALVEHAIGRLVTQLEAGRPDAWRAEEMGERYEQLARHVVAFEASVLSCQATFKLCQDEPPLAVRETMAALKDKDPVLAEWIARFNKDRLAS